MSEESTREGYVNIVVKQDGYGYDTNLSPAEVSYWLRLLALRVELEALGVKLPE